MSIYYYRYSLLWLRWEKCRSPIPLANFGTTPTQSWSGTPPNKAWHDKLVSLVERLLELHKRSPRLPQEQEMVKREVESTDGRIDRLVYELYGLTEDEIKIVES